MSAEPKLDIYFDGGCAFCQWARARIEPWDTRGRLRFVDYNATETGATPYSREELSREMHVRSPDGTWSSGFAAWIRILRVLPKLRWLGWLLSRAPFRWFGPAVYNWIARHRTILPGAPQPCATETCPIPGSVSPRRAS